MRCVSRLSRQRRRRSFSHDQPVCLCALHDASVVEFPLILCQEADFERKAKL